MNDLSAHLKTVFRTALFWIAGCLLVWAFWPAARPYAAGLILGTVVSLMNAQLLGYRISVFTDHLVRKTGKRVSLGFVARLCVCLLAVMLADKAAQFHLVATIIGFFYAPFVALGAGLLSLSRK